MYQSAVGARPSFVTGFQEASHFYGSPPIIQCIDLNPSETAILAQMKPKGRYNIGVAQRYGVSVVEDVSPQGIEDFFNYLRGDVTRKNSGHGPDYFYTLIPMLSASEHGSVFFPDTRRRDPQGYRSVFWSHGDILLWWFTCHSSQRNGTISSAFRDHAEGKNSRLPNL